MNTPTLALVVNTYNQPEYLSRVLAAIALQTQLPDEVLLADDGSGEETAQVFSTWSAQQEFRTRHVWIANDGFRRSRILNRAIAQATADYLVFLDGDTVPHAKFIEDHRAMATEGFFVQGHRALVGKNAALWFGKSSSAKDRLQVLFMMEHGSLKNAFRWPMPYRKICAHIRGVRGCNLGIWRQDLVTVNGYDEAFVGWGREDSDLAQRLMNVGVLRLDVRGRALCYHLWHPPANRSAIATNDQLLAETISQVRVRCTEGVDRYLAT